MNALLFVFGELISKGIPFLFIPVMTYFLTPSQYGEVSSLLALISAIQAVVLWGQSSIVPIKTAKKVEENKVYQGTFESILIVFLIVSILLFSFSNIILEALKLSSSLLLMALFTALLQAIFYLVIINYQAKKKAVLFVVFNTLSSILNFTLTVLIFYLYDATVETRALALITAWFIALAILLYRNFNLIKSSITFTGANIHEQLKYGATLFPHTFSSILRNTFDRVVIISFLGASTLGLYTISLQLGSVISILAVSFNRYLSQEVYEAIRHRKPQKLLIIKTLSFFLFFVVLYSCVVINYSYLLIKGDFELDKVVFLAFVLCGIVQFLYFIFANYLFYNNLNGKLSLVSFINMVVYFISLILFSQIWGLNGVVGSGLLSWLLLLMMTYYMYRRYVVCSEK